MFKVFLVSHGSLSKAFLETAELIAGKQNDVYTFGLNLGDDVEEFGEKVKRKVLNEKDDVLILSDLQSGSPFNITVGMMDNPKIHHITGMNLPMLLEVLSERQFMNVCDVCKDLAEKSKSTIVDVNMYLEEINNDSDE